MHHRNAHKDGYDMDTLCQSSPDLKAHIIDSKAGRKTIDFTQQKAVVALNAALLKQYYKINHWSLPEGYLCPAVPGRADYIHTIADLVGKKKGLRCLDIGTGANCIYPIIGSYVYNWTFVGTDIDPKALEACQQIIDKNPTLKDAVSLRPQTNPQNVFKGVIKIREHFDLTICNPPFHKSAEDALKGVTRKNKNLRHGNKTKHLNFQGQSNELWTEGGEKRFVRRMIKESRKYAKNSTWFSTLVSKEDHLKTYSKSLRDAEASRVEVLPLSQGNKVSRILAWQY